MWRWFLPWNWFWWIGLVVVIFVLFFVFAGSKRTYAYEGIKNVDDLVAWSWGSRSDDGPTDVSRPDNRLDRPFNEGGVFERECRRIFEDLFKKPFPKDSGSKFLYNPVSGRRLDFDGFNSELMVAFEYNGEQHYDQNSCFTRGNDKAHAYQIYKDILKRELADKAGIYLVTIPYNVKFKDLRKFIVSKLYPELREQHGITE